jgi:hypothetical protein
MTEDGALHHLPKANLKVHRLEDGGLLIVGKKAWGKAAQAGVVFNEYTEWPIIIHPDLLSTVMQGEIEKAVKAERERYALIDDEFVRLCEEMARQQCGMVRKGTGPINTEHYTRFTEAVLKSATAIRSTPSQGDEG